jgi:hypothetical protein
MRRLFLVISVLLLPAMSVADTMIRESLSVGTKHFNLLEVGEHIKEPWRNGTCHFQVSEKEDGLLFTQEVEISKFLQHVPSEKMVFFQRVGGNAVGWGLYRFDIKNNKLDYWSADAREIHINHNTGVIKVHYARHNIDNDGYLDDEVKLYHWPRQMSQPEEFQPK